MAMILNEVFRNLKRFSSLKLVNCDAPNNNYNSLINNRRQYSEETDPEDVDADEIGYKRSEAADDDTVWSSSALYNKIQPVEAKRKPPSLILSQQPPKLDWRTDISYRRVMGVMGGLGWKEGNKTNEQCMLNFCPSDESDIRHFKPLE